MKKILSIALIAALVLTSAFAATKYTGSAELDAIYDLEETDYGFKNVQAQKLTWGFDFETGNGGSEGEGDLRAEIAGAFTVSIKSGSYTATGDVADIRVNTLKISKANILYKEDLVIGILNEGTGKDYAESIYDFDDDGDADIDAIEGLAASAAVGGFTVSYKGYAGGFGTWGNVENETNETIAWVETKSYDVAEGATAQAAAAVLSVNGDVTVEANAKASYEKDDLSADAAVDFVADIANEDNLIEAKVTASYAPVTAIAYVVTDFEDAYVELKAAAEFEAEDVSGNAYVGTTFNVIDEVQGMVVLAGVEATYDVITASADFTYDIDGEFGTVAAKVTYAPEAFKAIAGVSLTVADDVTDIKPYASIETTKLIDNATCKLAWTTAAFESAADDKGIITASVKVSF